jgi:uncharacterized protein (DUF302 family)
MLKKVILLTGLMILITGCAPSLQNNQTVVTYYQVETTKPYDDVLAELEIAIAEHNFRITGHSRVGKVIRERGAENFPEYDTLQFCNLTHARTLLEINPHAVSYMPCNIVTYQFDGKTILRTHLLPTDTDQDNFNRFSATMNQTIRQIVDFAAEE